MTGPTATDHINSPGRPGDYTYNNMANIKQISYMCPDNQKPDVVEIDTTFEESEYK